MRLKLDQELCQGYASCVVAAADMFELDDDDGIAHLLVTDVSAPEDRQRAEVAVANCPARAIELADD